MTRLLIADDEEIILTGLSECLTQMNLDIEIVAKARNGLEVMKLIAEHRPEIVLMDINMPLLNGLETIERISKLYPDTICIILSGYNEFSYAQQAIALGVFRYLLKPVSIPELKKTLIEACDLVGKPVCMVPKQPDGEDIAYKVLEYILKNFSDSTITLSRLADNYHISSSHLARMIKEKTNITFSEYLGGIRIAEAKKLLESSPSTPVGEIGEMTGFNSPHYFSRAFKSATGLAPLEYRKNCGKSEE